MSIKRLDPGPRMSQAVIFQGVVSTAGQVAQRAGGEPVEAQTRDILARIDELLAEAGTDKSKLLTATIWLSDIGTFAEMNAVWDAWVDPNNAPTRACVESRLASPKFSVEIAVTAAI
ncbi:MAG: RidA family protein [Chromatiales bacterium]|jgi:enamine deaminase RidA (YjgF/YER057c/UK114 family)|nr:RidA family protein [Chromatiales bacterium]